MPFRYFWATLYSTKNGAAIVTRLCTFSKPFFSSYSVNDISILRIEVMRYNELERIREKNVLIAYKIEQREIEI